jgi:hypothetical protein
MFRSFSNGAEDPRPRPERQGLGSRLRKLWRMVFPTPAVDD